MSGQCLFNVPHLRRVGDALSGSRCNAALYGLRSSQDRRWPRVSRIWSKCFALSAQRIQLHAPRRLRIRQCRSVIACRQSSDWGQNLSFLEDRTSAAGGAGEARWRSGFAVETLFAARGATFLVASPARCWLEAHMRHRRRFPPSASQHSHRRYRCVYQVVAGLDCVERRMSAPKAVARMRARVGTCV